MSKNRIAAITAPALLLIALVGCTPGGGSGSDGTGSDGGASPADNRTECLAGKTWRLDTDDLAAQLAEQLSSSGLNVTEALAEGVQTFEFTESGEASSSVDVSYTLTVDSGDGIVITVVQTHAGNPSGEWAWLGDSDTVTFPSWDNAGYSIQNTVLVNGIASDSPINVPSDTLGDLDMDVECAGSELATHVESSPFTQHWSTEG